MVFAALRAAQCPRSTSSLLRFGPSDVPRNGLEGLVKRSWAQRRLTSGSRDVGSGTTDGVNSPMEGSNVEKIQFPDPRDPEQHPLAPLSTEEMQERKQYWEKVQSENKPPVYRQKLEEDGRAFAKGSRKRSRAKVWMGNGSGQIVVNGRPWVDYFQRLDHRDKILRPLGLLGLVGKMDIECQVVGGGPTGQAEAMRHGMARALQNWDPLFRPVLKEDGLLTRDSREVESKKYGRKKARKAFQWVKR